MALRIKIYTVQIEGTSSSVVSCHLDESDAGNEYWEAVGAWWDDIMGAPGNPAPNYPENEHGTIDVDAIEEILAEHSHYIEVVEQWVDMPCGLDDFPAWLLANQPEAAA